jgi:putative restriction endonuclease
MRNTWSDEEMILALDLYFKLPYGKLNQRTPEIQQLAHLIGRTPSSIALRLCNYAACDPHIINSGRKGMTAGVGKCLPYWEYYTNSPEKLFHQAEQIKASRLNQPIEKVLHLKTEDFIGKEKETVIKQRINQNAFRSIILANYNEKCAISGFCIPQLLIASHIIPWADDINNRLNPANGICLSPLYDKAFDKGYISIRPDDYTVIISKELKSYKNHDFYSACFASIDNKHIILPHKHSPAAEFLYYHINNIFNKHN